MIISYDEMEKAEELARRIGAPYEIYDNSFASTLYLSVFVLFIEQLLL